jgi:hypothetical protein
LTELSTGGLAWTVDVNPKPLDRVKVAINTGAANGNFIRISGKWETQRL